MKGEPVLNMTCGQTELHPWVQQAMGSPLSSTEYYFPYWELEVETIGLVQSLLQTQNDILLITGTATYGLEAVFQSILQPETTVLCLVSGMYGQLIRDIVGIVGGDPITITSEPGQPIHYADIQGILKDNPGITAVATVHCDTSVGILTPIDEIGKNLQVEFPDVLFIVDIVSTIGGHELKIDEWNIDISVSNAQKCLNGPQGVAIVSASAKVWDHIHSKAIVPSTLCLDLSTWRAYHNSVKRAYEAGVWEDEKAIPVARTVYGPLPSYSLIMGLNAALKAFFAQGSDIVYTRHKKVSKALRDGLDFMGIDVCALPKYASSTATKLVFDCVSVDWDKIVEFMLNDHNILLPSEQRIGTMGINANIDAVVRTLDGLFATLGKLNYIVKAGAEIAKISYMRD